VFAELHFSVSGLPNYLRKEWESLKKYDVIFLMGVDGQQVGAVRGAEIISHMDEDRKNIVEFQKGNTRILQVLFDPAQYAKDFENGEVENIFLKMKAIVRRQAKENNFKAALQSIQDMVVNPPDLPEYLKESILGYGEYKQEIHKPFFDAFSFSDTFIDQAHFSESFEKNELLPLELKKMHKFNKQVDFQKPNQIKFTKQQTQAILQAVQPGMTLIKGPPGTGKTDVIVQSIALLYRNFPH